MNKQIEKNIKDIKQNFDLISGVAQVGLDNATSSVELGKINLKQMKIFEKIELRIKHIEELVKLCHEQMIEGSMKQSKINTEVERSLASRNVL